MNHVRLALLLALVCGGAWSKGAGPDWGSPPPQPGEETWKFVEDLKAPMWTHQPWVRRAAGPGEADLSGGIELKPGLADPKGRLDTAYEDLRRFLAAGSVSVSSGGYAIETAAASDLAGEAFRLDVGSRRCRILAGDVEGVRRGIFYLEDEMARARAAFLPVGKMERTPIITRRISRCFFGPIKRLPKMRDELMDDVDYYPEQYLNRMAHEGINGLWLTAEFHDLAATSFTPGAGRDAGRRLAKLRRTVAACLRYGIRTYIFCIEPVAWDGDDPVIGKFPTLAGAPTGVGGKRYFCPSSPEGAQYLYQAVNAIFTAVPELGGMINISHGERPTTCLSAVSAVGEGTVRCPRCSTKAPWEILFASLSAMEQGMHAAAPEAELISWLYMPQTRGPLADWVYDLPAHTPKGVILQFNFESGVRRTEFGREFTGGDYWLSTPGPSDRFERIATIARAHGTPVSAKIQTANSHELATVPEIPVPGLLHQKFAAMRRLGVTDTMLCWYFGNYPGLMNKSAGELSFEPFPVRNDDFLRRLAATYWARRDVAPVMAAWTHFSAGFQNYPLSILFQYYGPMHSGPVWPLCLKPLDAPLSPTWELGGRDRKPWPPSGDRVGECLLDVLTLPEAVELARRMSAEWDRGVAILGGLEGRYRDEPERIADIGVARALGIQFRSGYNILRFYLRREALFRMGGPERLAVLSELRGIVGEELKLDEELIGLCEKDSRLGFHSEAEGYMYYPAKLKWRMQELRRVLTDDAPELEQTIRRNQPLFPEYTGLRPTGPVAECVPVAAGAWRTPSNHLLAGLHWQPCAAGAAAGSARWAATYDRTSLYIVVDDAGAAISSVTVKVEPQRLWPSKHFVCKPGFGPQPVDLDRVSPISVEGRVLAKDSTWVLRIPLGSIGRTGENPAPVRMDVQVQAKGGAVSTWIPNHPLAYRLNLGPDNPADLGWMRFKGGL